MDPGSNHLLLDDWELGQSEMVLRIFQSFVGISLGVIFIGCAFIIQLVISFLGVIFCAKCFSGERALGLCAFIFTLICKFNFYSYNLTNFWFLWISSFDEFLINKFYQQTRLIGYWGNIIAGFRIYGVSEFQIFEKFPFLKHFQF